jgi:predicted enzyme related to lactoylglutathione lyase
MTDSTPTAYAPGTPSWVDISSPDVPATASFYSQLFGWQAQDLGEEAGHYTMFMQDGKQVAAASPIQDPGQPSAWMTYVATDDADATARNVTSAGGQVIVAPFDVMDQGKMGVFADPGGAVFSVWQAAAMKGAGLVNTPVSFAWNELATRDMGAAQAFYTKVFPWTAKDNDMGGGMSYTEWQVDGRSIGGGMSMGSMYPPQVPPHWLVYFSVARTDDAVKRAQDLGGKVLSPAQDIPQGRFAVLADPNGASFAVIQLPQ